MGRSKKSPNILFLFTDQLRADCIAALGNPTIKTPNIDRLVREGTSFDQCYTPSPVCVPARHSLITGKPPHETGCVDNIEANIRSPSFMEKLVERGYQTHGVGKMHFSQDLGDWGFTSRDVSEELDEPGKQDDYRKFLNDNGFQHVVDAHGLRSEYYYIPQPSQLPEKLHHSHWVADRSIDFLKNRDTSQPFLLWSSFIKPHPPFETPNPWGRLYRMHEMEEPILPEGSPDHASFWNLVQNRYKYIDGGNYDRHRARTIKAAYYSSISFIDYNVGRILDALGSELDRTLIIFSSDHGEMLGDYGFYGKRTMLNASVRIPLIARLPNKIPVNHRCRIPTTLLDIYPTLLGIAGDRTDRPSIEGKSLFDLVKKAPEDRIVFSQFSQNQLALYMATNENWKYIYSAADNKEWLFDLSNDPHELRNAICDVENQPHLELLKQACIERFESSGYTTSLVGKDWKRYPITEPPARQSDDGLLFQDPAALDDEIKRLGRYSRSTEFKFEEKYGLLKQLCDVSKPKVLQ